MHSFIPVYMLVFWLLAFRWCFLSKPKSFEAGESPTPRANLSPSDLLYMAMCGTVIVVGFASLGISVAPDVIGTSQHYVSFDDYDGLPQLHELMLQFTFVVSLILFVAGGISRIRSKDGVNYGFIWANRGIWHVCDLLLRSARL